MNWSYKFDSKRRRRRKERREGRKHRSGLNLNFDSDSESESDFDSDSDTEVRNQEGSERWKGRRLMWERMDRKLAPAIASLILKTLPVLEFEFSFSSSIHLESFLALGP